MPRRKKRKTTFLAGNAAGLQDIIEGFVGFPARVILPDHRGRRMTVWVVRNGQQLKKLMSAFEKHCKKGYCLTVETGTKARRRRG
ncbi:MAG: hypothetical protein AAB605_04165 [Patescibacteria group bacterium]